MSKRLDAIPGVGPALATALVGSIGDPKAFVPKQNSSGGKEKLGSISKQGDRYLRSLFTAGARRDPLCQTQWYQASAVAYGVVGAIRRSGQPTRATALSNACN
jgi:transposase